jgi:hypothetical protein
MLDEEPGMPLAAPASRQLLDTPLSYGGTRSLANWDGRVAAFGVGVLLLTAVAGTVIALCTLPTGTDTLLYARTKEA